MPYELIDHTADIGIRVWAQTLEELFSEACGAMFEQITDPDKLTETQSRNICVDGMDRTDLLINWLRACLMIWTAGQCLVKSAQMIKINATHAEARVFVQRFNPEQHVVSTDIKAVTYHNADLVRTANGWEAAVIFDV